jgi:hypothetical protein
MSDMELLVVFAVFFMVGQVLGLMLSRNRYR